MPFKINTAVTGFRVGLTSATDGSDITTGTPVGYYIVSGGSQLAIGDTTPFHEGNGLWTFDLTAAEMNGSIVALSFTHASAITQHFTIKTESKIVSELNDFDAAADTVTKIKAGYQDGAVWINSNGSAGTVSYVNGTADNPCTTLASALTVAAALNLYKLRIAPNETITPSANLVGYYLLGHRYSVVLGGFDYSNTYIEGANVAGVALAATGEMQLSGCTVTDITVDEAHFDNCGFNGTLTMGAASGDIAITNSYSQIAGTSTPVFDFGTSVGINHHITFGNWQNGMQIVNYNNSGADLFSLSGTGKLIIASSCSGTVNVRGSFGVIDNTASAITFNYDDNRSNIDIISDTDGVILGAAGVDLIWDELLTGATHNVNNSAGKRLRIVDAAFEVHSGTAVAGSTSTTLNMDALADGITDNIYSGDRVVIVGGTGIGEHGLILSYASATKIATMSKAWVVTPDNTSEFVVAPADTDVEMWNDNTVTGDGDWAELQTDVDATLVDTATTIPALIAALENASLTDIKTQIVNALSVDTYAENVAVPAATATLEEKLTFLFTVARNKVTQTATTQLIRNDADSGTIASATVSDDGTTFIRTEYT